MKTLVKPTLVLLFFVALCALPSQVTAQLSANTATSFSITIEIDGNNTTLACNGGWFQRDILKIYALHQSLIKKCD